ncbi:MAG: ATP-binding cassette domain-containing protein [Pseudomonadota bacterium]
MLDRPHDLDWPLDAVTAGPGAIDQGAVDRGAADLGAADQADEDPAAPPEPAPALAARGLTYGVGGANLLDGVDLDLPRGRLTVALGPNGAGKSLLLRLLHGLTSPTAGDVAAAPDCAAAQAMVLQKPVLLRRSVAANLDFVLRRSTPRAERAERRADLLAAVELADKAALPARRLSGGEQQRLAMARALATKPRLLFLDEPTASLDPASTAVIERLIRAERARGVTILLVTHDLAQTRRLADRVLFLDQGRIVEAAPAPRFFAGPVSPSAQSYLDGRLPL